MVDISTCPICGSPPPFLDGHVFPRWAAMEIRAEKGEDSAHLIAVSRTGNTKRTPTGFYVKDWLCRSCEARTSIWENSAKRLLLDEEPTWIPLLKQEQIQAWSRADIDALDLKMFFVQLLVKAHLATPSHGYNVHLGPLFEMAADAVAGRSSLAATEFAVFVSRYVNVPPARLGLSKAMLGPSPGHFCGQRSYKISIAGYTAHVVASPRIADKRLQRICLGGDPDRVTILAVSFEGKELQPFVELAAASRRVDAQRAKIRLAKRGSNKDPA